MSRRKTSGSNGGDGDNGYEIGYRKPPKHSQFRPGHSGNSVGRRQGLRNGLAHEDAGRAADVRPQPALSDGAITTLGRHDRLW